MLNCLGGNLSVLFTFEDVKGLIIKLRSNFLRTFSIKCYDSGSKGSVEGLVEFERAAKGCTDRSCLAGLSAKGACDELMVWLKRGFVGIFLKGDGTGMFAADFPLKKLSWLGLLLLAVRGVKFLGVCLRELNTTSRDS